MDNFGFTGKWQIRKVKFKPDMSMFKLKIKMSKTKLSEVILGKRRGKFSPDHWRTGNKKSNIKRNFMGVDSTPRPPLGFVQITSAIQENWYKETASVCEHERAQNTFEKMWELLNNFEILLRRHSHRSRAHLVICY